MEDLTTVTGEMAVLLGALGCRQGDSQVLEVIALAGPDMTIEEFDFDGEKSTYFDFKPTGTDLLFENDVLVSVMVRTQSDSKDETFGLYPRPAALIAGLSPTAIRAEVAAFLGNPERVGPNFDRYDVNNRYLHFEFNSNGRIAKLSALLESI